MWWKRYEHILEKKPVSGAEAIKDLIAKELAELYAGFPPTEGEVAWSDPHLEERFAGRLSELPHVDAGMVRILTQVVVWDLAHETDAIDHFFRNQLHREVASTEVHVEALHLLWRNVVEHLYARKEECSDILKRADLVDIAEHAAFLHRTKLAGVQ